MQSTCQQQQAQPGQNGTSASRTSFLIEDILSRGTVAPPHSHHQLHHQHLTSSHGVQHQQYQQFANLLPGYPSAPPTATFFLGPLFGNTAMGVGVVPGVTELAALKHCRRRKARTVSESLSFFSLAVHRLCIFWFRFLIDYVSSDFISFSSFAVYYIHAVHFFRRWKYQNDRLCIFWFYFFLFFRCLLHSRCSLLSTLEISKR